MVESNGTFGYTPVSLSDALDFLAHSDAMVFAGGTDLMVKHRRIGGLPPDFRKPVLYISQLHALRGIQRDGNLLTIRAATPMSELLTSPLVPKFIKTVLDEIASVSIRNLATIGGNICNASPAGDSIPMLVALDAMLEITSLMEKRYVKIADFITGPGKIALARDELLTAIQVPLSPSHDDRLTYNHYMYKKVGQRRSNAISKIAFFGIASRDQDGFHDIRMAYGAAGPTVVRSYAAESLILETNHERMASRMDLIQETVSHALSPIDDLRSSKEYRMEVLLNLTKSFILERW